MKTIIGIKVGNRLEEVDRMQDILTEQGSIINTRVGLHQGNTSQEGIILLELTDETENKCQELEESLKSIGGIEVSKMTFA